MENIMVDTSLYDLGNGRGRITETPSGRLTLAGLPIEDGDRLYLLIDGGWSEIEVRTDGEWYAVRAGVEYTLIEGMEARW